MKNLFFAKNKNRRNPVFFIMLIIEKYAFCRFVQNAQTRAQIATVRIKTLAKKPRFFCKCFFQKNEKFFWRFSGVF